MMPPRSLLKSHPPLPALPSLSKSSPNTSTITKNTIKYSLLTLEKTVDGLPILGLKTAVRDLLGVIKIIYKAKHSQPGLQDLVIHLGHLENAVRPLSGQQHLSISPAQEACISRLTTELFTLANDWHKLKTAHKFTHRFINYEDYAQAIGDMNRRLKESVDAFLLDDQTAGATITENPPHAAVRVDRHLLSKEVRALPRANAAYNSLSRNDAPTCFRGTRQGVLDDFLNWFITGSTFMYALLGIAGVGKSTIAQTVATLITGRNQLAASFFFSKYENDLSTSRAFFPTLAFQLAQHSEVIAIRISEALKVLPDAAHQTLAQQVQKLIIEPLQDIPSSTPPMLIVLDALDECEEKGAAEILRLLLARLSTLPFIKVFLTTRPEPHIKRILEQTKTRDGLVLHDVEASVVSEDIAKFLKHQLSTEEVEKVLPGCGWKYDAKDMDALVRSAGRLFIVASTSEKFIKDEKQRNPQRQLRLLLGHPEQAQGSKRSPFAVLDQLYLRVLESAVPTDQSDGDDIERFQNVVGAIITLQDPLSPNSLAILLHMDVFDVKAVFDLLQSIIVHSDVDPRPRIYHPSFTDFITNQNRCNQSRFLINTPQHHARIAGLCLDLMDRLLKRNICGLGILDQHKKNEDIPELEVKVNAHIPPELVYACSFWAVHLSKCLPHGSDILEKVYRFMFKHLLFWLEALSLSGHMETAYPSVQHAQRFIAHHGAPPELLRLLNDAHRFVMGSQEIVGLSALHVYYSILPFTPSETLLWWTYESEAMSSMRVLAGREGGWDPLLAALAGHSDFVMSIALSSDGALLASGSGDETVRLWNAATGTPLYTLEGHSHWVTSLAFSPDDNLLVSASNDKTIRVWDAATGGSLFTLEGHSGWITSVSFSLNSTRLASASGDKTVRLWDAATGKLLSTLEGHSDCVNSVIFSLDGAYLASASKDKMGRVWDVATGASLFTLEGHEREVHSIVFSPNGTRLASASDDNTGRLWHAVTGALLVNLEGHSGQVYSVVFSPSGTRLASASRDTTVRLWDAATGATLFKLEGHSGPVNSVMFSPNGNRLASASGDRTVKFFDVATGESLLKLEGHSDPVRPILFSPDGSRLVSASDDHTMRLWDAAAEASPFELEGHSDEVTSIVFSPDGKRFATGSNDNTARIWDAVTGETLFKLEGHSNWVRSVAFSHDSNHLASGSLDNTVRIWDTIKGVSLFKLEGHSKGVCSVVFSPDSSRLASASWDETVKLWDAETGISFLTLEDHLPFANLLAFSSGGNRLASLSSDRRTVLVWDAITGASLFRLKGHMALVKSLRFSPDSTHLVSASEDNVVQLWDATAGIPVDQYHGSLHFTLDGCAYILQTDQFHQLPWCASTRTQPPVQANIFDRPDADSPSKFLTLVLDDQTQSYVVCAPIGKEAVRVNLCWLPFGHTKARHAWNGSVMAVGLGDGRITFLDSAALRFG